MNIEDYKYQIDEFGNVYNSKGLKLKPSISNKGYLMYKLFIDGKRKWISPHRYVALYWVDNPDNKPQVNHIDGVKTNNHYTNLEWVTNQENRDKAIKLGLHSHGEKVSKKFKNEDIIFIRTTELSARELSLKYKVNEGTIWKIRKGVRWKHL